MPVSDCQRPFPIEEHCLRVGVPKYPAIAYGLQLSMRLECAQLLVVRCFPLYHSLLAGRSSRPSLLLVLFLPPLVLLTPLVSLAPLSSGRYCAVTILSRR